MKIYLSIFLLFLNGCATITRAPNDNNPVDVPYNGEELAIVNGEKITINEYNERLKQLSPYEKAMYKSEKGHVEFLNTLIQQKLMVQRARELELDKDAGIQKKIEYLKNRVTENVLIEALVKREVLDKTVVTDKEAKAYYDEHLEEFKKNKAATQEFYEVSEEIKKKLIFDKQKKEYQELLRQLETEAKIEIKQALVNLP